MCGRFCIAASPGELEDRYKVSIPPEYKPRYNLAPGQMVFTIGSSSEMTEWGIILPGMKRIINARVESIQEKPLFKKLFSDHRCLIPSSGYYEWKHEGSHKIPYYFSSKTNPILSFAGVIRPSSEGNQAVILTREATQPYSEIHSRMPVILNSDSEEEYLSNGRIETYDALQMFEVSSWVNQISIDEPDLIKPVQKSFVQQKLLF